MYFVSTIVKGGDKMLYLKLVAKKRMMNDTLRCFFISVLPFLTLCLLVVINYYLPFFLKKTIFVTDNFFSVFITTLSIVFSYCFWKSICLIKDKFFLIKSNYKKARFWKSVKGISLKQYITFWTVSVLRMLLSVSWAALYFSPCLIMIILLIYSYRYENYGQNVNLTLFVSAIMLFLIGASHFFVTLKRYSMCEAIILKDKQKNPLNVITESITEMENHSIKYSLYCLSFMGWVLSCVFVIPVFYVLPFVNISKWCYISHLNKSEETENEKPIVFYIQKQIKNGG
jgi:hypothetical protein